MKHYMTKQMKKWWLIPVLLLAVGCEDFLEQKPQGQLLQTSFPVTAADALAATNAAYASLRNWYFNFGGYPIADIMSDDARKGSSPADQLSTVGSYDNFTINVQQDGLDRWWSALYQGIKATNIVLTYIPNIAMDDALKTRYLAEARFLRALYYFDLVRAWGDVPKVTSPEPPLDLVRSPVQEIYDEIILPDLMFAYANLPEKNGFTGSDVGRATKGAVRAYLAKVYLFLPTPDYVNAEKYALEVINSSLYDLETDFGDATGIDGNFGIESIFEVGAAPNDGLENGGAQYANTQGIRGAPNRGWGFNRPSPDLMNSFEANDPRKDATIIFLGEVLDGVVTLGDFTCPDTTYQNSVIIEIECYNQKVWTPGNNTQSQWGHHRRLMRYADVLLMAAEALNENGDPATALTHLNYVRQRARTGAVPGTLPDITETNKDLLRDIIINERRHELAMEGHRFWDLVRTGKATAVLGPLGYTDKYKLLPVPQTQIDLSKGRLTQNPGWTN